MVGIGWVMQGTLYDKLCRNAGWSMKRGGYIKLKKKKCKRAREESTFVWSTAVGPDPSVVDPTEFVKITMVRVVKVVKVVNWGEDDGGRGWSWEI